MASDDLRARLAEVLCPPHHRVGSFSSGQPVTALSPCQLHQAEADAVLAVVQPELDRRDKRIEDYRKSRQRWMDAAYADRRAANRVVEERDHALAALEAVRDAQSLGEALAAVAKHDGITTEPFSPPAGAAVCVICREWDTDFAKHTRCPSCGQPWIVQPTTKENLS